MECAPAAHNQIAEKVIINSVSVIPPNPDWPRLSRPLPGTSLRRPFRGFFPHDRRAFPYVVYRGSG
jgi:hypothetical protein